MTNNHLNPRLGGNLGGVDFGHHPTGGQLGAFRPGQRLDLRRQLGHRVDEGGVGVFFRVGGVQTVDVGE